MYRDFLMIHMVKKKEIKEAPLAGCKILSLKQKHAFKAGSKWYGINIKKTRLRRWFRSNDFVLRVANLVPGPTLALSCDKGNAGSGNEIVGLPDSERKNLISMREFWPRTSRVSLKKWREFHRSCKLKSYDLSLLFQFSQ